MRSRCKRGFLLLLTRHWVLIRLDNAVALTYYGSHESGWQIRQHSQAALEQVSGTKKHSILACVWDKSCLKLYKQSYTLPSAAPNH